MKGRNQQTEQLWQCSVCKSPGAQPESEGPKGYFPGLVCNRCGFVLCGTCITALSNRKCSCGGSLVPTKFDPCKRPMDLTKVKFGRHGAKDYLQFLGVLIFLIAFVAPVILFFRIQTIPADLSPLPSLREELRCVKCDRRATRGTNFYLVGGDVWLFKKPLRVYCNLHAPSYADIYPGFTVSACFFAFVLPLGLAYKVFEWSY